MEVKLLRSSCAELDAERRRRHRVAQMYDSCWKLVSLFVRNAETCWEKCNEIGVNYVSVFNVRVGELFRRPFHKTGVVKTTNDQKLSC